jgi:hypothetical protein
MAKLIGFIEKVGIEGELDSFVSDVSLSGACPSDYTGVAGLCECEAGVWGGGDTPITRRTCKECWKIALIDRYVRAGKE